MLPRKMCGGGSNLASAQPTAQSSSQIPANSPIEAAPQRNVGAAERIAAAQRPADNPAGRAVTAAWVADT